MLQIKLNFLRQNHANFRKTHQIYYTITSCLMFSFLYKLKCVPIQKFNYVLCCWFFFSPPPPNHPRRKFTDWRLFSWQLNWVNEWNWGKKKILEFQKIWSETKINITSFEFGFPFQNVNERKKNAQIELRENEKKLKLSNFPCD